MDPTCSRRGFIASCAGALLAVHDTLTAAPLAAAGDGHRLLRLRMASAAPLEDMARFYGRVLGLPISRPDDRTVRVTAGGTALIFERDAPPGSPPFYHFAVNIPENKIAAAHEWQRQRTDLLPIPRTLQDATLPREVVHYRHWNAHSIFFFDPAGNVVEYIARHALRNGSAGPFTPADILYASEIALVVDDVLEATDRIGQAAMLGRYGAPSEAFAALGDEYGLVLVMRRGRVISFDSPRRSAVGVFPTGVVVRGARRATMPPLAAFPYDLAVEPVG
jgi:hypothetical protein